jgi:hypothetical protein
MATFPIATKPNPDELRHQRARQRSAQDGREILHDLMNQLTVIDLCTFQLRSTVSPFTLSALERAVENALRAAKQLTAEISSGTAKPGS